MSRWIASGHWLTASVFSLVFDFRWMDLWCDCCFFRSSGIVFSSWVSAIADGYQRMLIAEWWTSTISWNFTKYIRNHIQITGRDFGSTISPYLIMIKQHRKIAWRTDLDLRKFKVKNSKYYPEVSFSANLLSEIGFHL